MPRRAVDDAAEPTTPDDPVAGAPEREGAGDLWQTAPGRLLAAARAEHLGARGRILDRDERERDWQEERLGSRA